MKKFLLFVLLIGVLMVICDYCLEGIGHKDAYQVSESIEQSIELGVFLDEYEAADIAVWDSAHNFPIEGAWTEKTWYYGLDSITKKEVLRVNSNSKGQIVWKLYDNDTTLNTTKYNRDWVISGLGGVGGGWTGRHELRNKFKAISGIPRTLSVEENIYTIYRKNSKHAFDTINHTKLFEFKLKRKKP